MSDVGTTAPQRKPRSPRTTRRTVLVVLGIVVGFLGLVVLVIAVLVGIFLQGSRPPVVTPAPQASESTPTDPEDLGEFTPTYELRELSTLEFPETFEGYDNVSDYTGSITRSTSYEEVAGPGVFTAMVTLSPWAFASSVNYFPDPVLIGDAVCGATSEDGVNKECVMAGIEDELRISTAGESMTLEELARIIEEFYALP